MTSERSIAGGARLRSQNHHVALAGNVGDFGRAAAAASHTYLSGVSPNFSLSQRGTSGGSVGEGAFGGGCVIKPTHLLASRAESARR